MTARRSKKAVIREYVERERPASAGRAEAAALREELRRALGPEARISDEYLMSVLDGLGVRVSRDLRGVSPEVYALLHFGSLEAAETTLRQLDEHCRRALQAGDAEAAGDGRDAAIFVRHRCELIAQNLNVAPAKRAEKEEIARWFAIWLQTPDVFFDWLELRKATDEYKELTRDEPGRN